MGIAALRDVLTAFEAEGCRPAEMEATVSQDIERLQGLQNFDGGFPYWRRGQESIPFNTIHVAHALQRAELKGFDVPQNMQDQLQPYLQNIESYYPHWYSLRTRWTLSAYALYVRDLMGDNDPAKARQLLDEAGLDGIPLEAVGWIWQVLADDPNSGPELEAIRRYVANRAVETAGAANFTTEYDDQTYLTLSSNRRTDAVLLDALIADNPDSDLIPKLVNGLLAHRKQGRWGNTQENVFVLLALDRYFTTYEAQTPDFVARIWLGETYAANHAYEGYTTERHETQSRWSI
jgi:alpha-2-macroglobulin